ncbi:hypothetical protein GQ600_533 [Phytophthora cactorum]|nr:hypothetical protein GQ600_533 [Phytophthora cactorum]
MSRSTLFPNSIRPSLGASAHLPFINSPTRSIIKARWESRLVCSSRISRRRLKECPSAMENRPRI